MTRIFGHNQFLGHCHNRWEAGGFSIARLSQTVPEERVEEHAHAEAHFVVFMSGLYVSSAAGAPPVADQPMIVYNPPGTRHRDRFRGEDGRFLTVAVPAALLRAFADAVALPDYPCVLDASALGIAASLVDSGRISAPADDLAMESLCVELLAAATKRHQRSAKRPPAWLWRVRELLHDDCGATLQLADAATIGGVHPVHLTRAFRRHFGCTPGDYLRRCRLLKSAALLAQDHAGLADIATVCGFFDQAHFSRAFKASFGMSPRRYRQLAA